MAPKRAPSKKLSKPPPEPEPEPEPVEVDPITEETKRKRAELCKAYFEQQVAKTIADNQAAAEAAAAAEQAKQEAEAEAKRKAEEDEAWRQKMMRLRGEVESRMDALHRMQEDRAKEEEGNMKQKLLNTGIRLPQMATLLPCVLLYDAETTSFEERFFVRQIAKLLESGGIKVWWDYGMGLRRSPDKLLHRMEVANKARLVVIVGSSRYLSSKYFEDEAALLYTRTVGGYKNGVENLQVLHIAYDDVPIPEKYRGAKGGLNFATADPITLPAQMPNSASWLDRARIAASSIGSAAPHMLSSRVAFFLSISCSSSLRAAISDAAKRTPEKWAAANRVDDKHQLHNFQVTPVADWKPEDLILGMSFLGECIKPNTRRLLDLGIDGWLLELVDDRVLEACGVPVPGHRRAILKLLEDHANPTSEGGYLDPNALSIYDLDGETMKTEVQKIFNAGDRDGDGFLNAKEFKEVLRTTRLELDAADMRKVIAEVDADDNGMIDYEEFLPVMIGLIMGIRAQQSAVTEISSKEAIFKDEAMNMVAGMSKQELNYKLRELFIRADADNSGGLTHGEFLNCLRSEELNLSRQQINMMMGEFEDDDDGVLTYEEFVPIAIDVLLESSKSALEEQQLSGRARGYESLLIKAFKRLEPSGLSRHGRIRTEVARVLLNCLAYERVIELGSVHIATIMTAVDPNERGMISCTRFAFLAAKMINAYFESAQTTEVIVGHPVKQPKRRLTKVRTWRSIASREGNASRLEGLTVGPNAAPRRPVNAVPPRTSSQQAQRRGRPGTVDSTCGPGTGILTKAAALGPLRPSSQAASDMLSMKSVDIGNENSAVGFLPPIGSRPHSVLGFGNTMHPTKPDRVQDRNPHKISPGLCI